MNSKQSKICIFCAEKDHTYYTLLSENIRAMDRIPWLASGNIRPGDDEGWILREILNECNSCFVLLSANYVSSNFAADELKVIEEHSHRIDFAVFPVLVPGTDPAELKDLPEFIKQRHWVDLNTLLVGSDGKGVLSSLIERNNSIAETEQTRQKSGKALRTKRNITLPDIDWVEIPAGNFIFGDRPERPTADLDRFFISRYPITVSQYQTFSFSRNYDDKRWWAGLEKPEPKITTWPQINRPIEMVSYYEAIAFTRWLSMQLGYEISLPTHFQWEKAARGNDGRHFPWGNKYTKGDANVYDLSFGDENLEQTTAVGMFPHRASPNGIMDMAGNVWEWCLQNGDAPQQTGRSNTHGGSWFDEPEFARCTSYRFDQMDTQINRIGFRVVCRFPHGYS